jgi:hypothetical protein
MALPAVGIGARLELLWRSLKVVTVTARAGVVVGQSKFKNTTSKKFSHVLYRGGKRPSRAVQRTRRRRPVGGHTPVGLATAGGLAEIAAGVLGTARRRRGSRRQAVERLGERRIPRAWSGPARGRPVFFWGRPRCAAWLACGSKKPCRSISNALESQCSQPPAPLSTEPSQQRSRNKAQAQLQPDHTALVTAGGLFLLLLLTELLPATGPRVDRGRANAGENAEYTDLAAPGLDPSYAYLASPGDWRCII